MALPPTRSLGGASPITSFADLLSTAGGIGYIPLAPGTFGSLPGLLVGAGGHYFCAYWWGLDPTGALGGRALVGAAILVLLASAVAIWSIGHTERAWRRHDDKRIVIDEVVGQMLVTIALPLSWPLYLAAFLLFRLFDIWKPGPAGWVDRNLASAFGTLLDDLIAALYAVVILACYLYLGLPTT